MYYLFCSKTAMYIVLILTNQLKVERYCLKLYPKVYTNRLRHQLRPKNFQDLLVIDDMLLHNFWCYNYSLKK